MQQCEPQLFAAPLSVPCQGQLRTDCSRLGSECEAEVIVMLLSAGKGLFEWDTKPMGIPKYFL